MHREERNLTFSCSRLRLRIWSRKTDRFSAVPARGNRGLLHGCSTWTLRQEHYYYSKLCIVHQQQVLLRIIICPYRQLSKRPDQTRPDQIRSDQIRPNQTRSDQIRPDQTKPDQTRPDHRMTLYKRALEMTRCETIVQTTLRTRKRFCGRGAHHPNERRAGGRFLFLFFSSPL